MTVTIADGLGASTTPDLLTQWRSSRSAGSLVHRPVANEAAPLVDLLAATLRAGSFTCVYTGPDARARAFDAERILAQARSFTLTDTAIPQTNMTFVLAGTVDLGPSSGGTGWELSIGFEQVG